MTKKKEGAVIGRPKIGQMVTVPLPESLVESLDAWSKVTGRKRNELIRALLARDVEAVQPLLDLLAAKEPKD